MGGEIETTLMGCDGGGVGNGDGGVRDLMQLELERQRDQEFRAAIVHSWGYRTQGMDPIDAEIDLDDRRRSRNSHCCG